MGKGGNKRVTEDEIAELKLQVANLKYESADGKLALKLQENEILKAENENQKAMIEALEAENKELAAEKRELAAEVRALNADNKNLIRMVSSEPILEAKGPKEKPGQAEQAPKRGSLKRRRSPAAEEAAEQVFVRGDGQVVPKKQKQEREGDGPHVGPYHPDPFTRAATEPQALRPPRWWSAGDHQRWREASSASDQIFLLYNASARRSNGAHVVAPRDLRPGHWAEFVNANPARQQRLIQMSDETNREILQTQASTGATESAPDTFVKVERGAEKKVKDESPDDTERTTWMALPFES